MSLNDLHQVDHGELHDLIVDIGSEQSIMTWGPPGIGKSATIEELSKFLGMRYAQFIGSQINPEDMAVPLVDPTTGTTRLCPPYRIFGGEEGSQPILILIDEINAAEPDVQRAFFQLVNERRIGDRDLPRGSIVVGAGNMIATNSVARPLAGPLMNRFYHVRLTLKDTKSWLDWAADPSRKIHPIMMDYISQHGVKTLIGSPRGDDEIATSPRSWAALGKVLSSRCFEIDKKIELVREKVITPGKFQGHVARVAGGAVHAEDAEHFARWWAMQLSTIDLGRILSGEEKFPLDQAETLTAVALIEQLRKRLGSELPTLRTELKPSGQKLAGAALRILQQLQLARPELVRSVIADENVPGWFLDEIATEPSRAN